jgi:transglutaminase/protease-like cytokinesis protein 3
MYSLGYQTLYILGYALDKKIVYGIEDAHAWSLVNIDGKWLPFDATWGIFSGKLPITHVFKQTDCKGIKTLSYDRVKIEQIKVKGNVL